MLAGLGLRPDADRGVASRQEDQLLHWRDAWRGSGCFLSYGAYVDKSMGHIAVANWSDAKSSVQLDSKQQIIVDGCR